ncbi:MAG: DUF4143 domain-containing protein [Oligoflexia bacterium]|nr:DUF4143 domain-containing protein [Oligoflexia bacterium]
MQLNLHIVERADPALEPGRAATVLAERYPEKGFAAPCGVSHTTIATYLNAMAEIHIAYVLRPYHRNQAKEIISAPKVYFFDTGFITYFKGSTRSIPRSWGISGSIWS